MRTLTTVEAVEKKDSGAYVVTFLGGNKAGTFDAEIGATAEKALAEGHSVELEVEKREGGKLFIVALELILPPEELGGPAEIAPEVPATKEGLEAAALVKPFGPDEAGGPMAGHNPAEEAATKAAPLSGFSSAELLGELVKRHG